MHPGSRCGALALALAFGAIAIAAGAPAHAQETLRLYAAGGLRAAMDDVAAAFTKETGIRVAAEYGASGLLRDRLAAGEAADVFASANMEHPRALSMAGRAGTVTMFARDTLCALVAPGADVSTDTLLDRMLDPAVKVGTSTPKADPSGDHAFEAFAKAEALRPGARATLEAKAQQLTGGPDSPPPPPDRNVYGVLVASGKADVFLTYCTNAIVARAENPALKVVALPESLAVGANYGLTVIAGANPSAARFVAFVMGAGGQRVLARHGFAAPVLPSAPPARISP